MTTAGWHDIAVTACILAVVVVVALILGWALGWVEGSLSLRLVPPWKRKAAEPRPRSAPAEQDLTGPMPLPGRKAS